jgi:hypothetical protein
MADWTRERVEERLSEASAVLAALPGPQRRGYFSTWPDVVLTAREIAEQAPRPMKVLPSPQAISRMEETITWNRFLSRFHANLVWARADGMPWKHICHRFGVTRATAVRHWEYAVCVITWQLNGREVNRKRGMDYLIERTRKLRWARPATREGSEVA